MIEIHKAFSSELSHETKLIKISRLKPWEVLIFHREILASYSQIKTWKYYCFPKIPHPSQFVIIICSNTTTIEIDCLATVKDEKKDKCSPQLRNHTVTYTEPLIISWSTQKARPVLFSNQSANHRVTP